MMKLPNGEGATGLALTVLVVVLVGVVLLLVRACGERRTTTTRADRDYVAAHAREWRCF